MTQVNFESLTRGEVRMLAGHPRGLRAREHFKLDQTDASNGKIVLVAPEELDTITTSFWQGFLSASLDALGEQKLRLLFDISQLPTHLQSDFELGLKRLLIRRRNTVH